MTKRTMLAGILLAGSLLFAAADYRLEARKTVGDATPRRPEKVLVVGISDVREIRNRFEDKLSSHFRTREMAAMASHTLVPSLTQIGDRDQILLAIDKEGVDAVMTVRAVGMDQAAEAGWAEAWNAWTAKDPRIGELIAESLPWPEKRAKRYGIEFGLWSGRPARLVWAARSGVVARKDLEAGVGDLLQLVLQELKDARWL